MNAKPLILAALSILLACASPSVRGAPESVRSRVVRGDFDADQLPDVKLSWNTEPGWIYYVEVSTSLENQSWSTHSSVRIPEYFAGYQGGSEFLVFPVANGPRFFFRVMRIPADGDEDKDGVENGGELAPGTDPFNADTDGDGITDGGELDQCTDPTDPESTPRNEWLILTGDGEEDVVKTASRTVSVPAGTRFLLAVAVASDEYPDWTSPETRPDYNDILTWSVAPQGHPPIAGNLDVNTRHGSWLADEDAGVRFPAFGLVHLEALEAFEAPPDSPMEFAISLAAVNIGDGLKPSTVMVGILPYGVALDFNRDGEISFGASDRVPEGEFFDFWLNDDRDMGHQVDGDDWEEDDVDEDEKTSPDWMESGLTCRRDLEDLERLRLDFSGLADLFPPGGGAGFSLRVRLDAADGSTPGVTFFRPFEPDGGLGYLKDEATGFNQIDQVPWKNEIGHAWGAQPAEIPSEAWESLTSEGAVPLLFEGALPGRADIVFELRRSGETVVAFPPLPLRLSPCHDLYETYTVGDVEEPGVDWSPQTWPAASPGAPIHGAGLPAPQTEPEKNCIVFVHGWNMPPWEKTAWADTVFKRLRRHGYKGRFVAFRWPTFHNFPDSFNTGHYDGSEDRAWNSAPGLVALVENLKSRGFKVRLYAHSMGNVVASEALRLMAAAAPDRVTGVHTYVASEAAISSHVFDNTTPEMPHDGVTPPNVHGYYWQPGTTSEPHLWQSESKPSYMDTQYMPVDVHFVNHYNPLDWALGWDNWEWNQRLKPDATYFYGHPDEDQSSPPRQYFHKRIPYYYDELVFPADRYNIFAFAVESWGYATGKQGATGGKFDISESVNLRQEFGFEDTHKGHSAQFRSTIQKRWTYWTKAIKDMGLNVPDLLE